MHRRRAALSALCGGGVLAARGTAGRKAGRCAGFDARYLGAYLRFGRAAWQCGCDMRGSHCAQAGYRVVCSGYAICGGLHSDRPAHRLQLHGNPLHVTALAWRSGRYGTRYAQAESTLRRVIAACVAVTRSAFVLSQAVASAQAARQSAARTCIGSATWPPRHALCSGRIDA